MTLAVRLSGLAVAGDVVRWSGARLFIAGGLANDAVLGFELGFAHNAAPLRLTAPVARLGTKGPREIVVRYLGYRLEMWVDGVLVDEDWPVGPVRVMAGAAQIAPTGVEQLRWWSRALSDEAVIGGADERVKVVERAGRFFGAEVAVGQYWRPRGFNVNVGDCMPFWDEAQGRFRVFYLFDRRNHASMWGCGGHQWAQISTGDLKHWEQHPLALAIDAETAGSICTGSVFYHAGVYHAFYAVRMADRSPAPLCVATSRDGVHFAKAPPLTRLGPPYDGQASRDPVVFRDQATGRFHMLMTTALTDPANPSTSTGCLAWLVSDDLLNWTQREPFYVSDGADQPECPDYFEWNGWYYLIFSLQGVARYRRSRQPFGPWERPVVETLDDAQRRVMKTAAYRDNRRLGVVFVSDNNGYAGRMVVRELIQRVDGTLGTEWPVELPPMAG